VADETAWTAVSGLYVYAFCDERPAGLPASGIAGEALRLVDAGGILAVVGAVERRPAAGEAAIRAHDAVVRRVAEGAPSVLPARFGSFAPDEEAIGALVRSFRSPLDEALQAVKGREQMTLRVFAPAALREPAARSLPRSAPPPPSGTRYLQERARLLASVERAPAIAALSSALAPWVRAERVDPHASALLLATLYHLVDRGSASEYLRAVESVAPRTRGACVRASGPFPAYAFVPRELS
jgi:hypothetical protein